MNIISTKFLILIALLQVIFTFSRQNISGKIVDEDRNNLTGVLVFNTTKNTKAYSNISGDYLIEAQENDEVKFIKQGFYRIDKIIKKETFNSPLEIQLVRAETLIQEVKIDYKPTGNLGKDSKHLENSKKVVALQSSIFNQ